MDRRGLSDFDLQSVLKLRTWSAMFFHPLHFFVGKVSHGEAFQQPDCEMSRGIHEYRIFGGAADGSKPVLESRLLFPIGPGGTADCDQRFFVF